MVSEGPTSAPPAAIPRSRSRSRSRQACVVGIACGVGRGIRHGDAIRWPERIASPWSDSPWSGGPRNERPDPALRSLRQRLAFLAQTTARDRDVRLGPDLLELRVDRPGFVILALL